MWFEKVRDFIFRLYRPALLADTDTSIFGDIDGIFWRWYQYQNNFLVQDMTSTHSHCVCVLTQFPGRFDVNVVVAAADADDDAQSFKLFQVFSHKSDGVVHQSAYCFIQHLHTHTHTNTHTHRVI